jgi:hypothetical protein
VPFGYGHNVWYVRDQSGALIGDELPTAFCFDNNGCTILTGENTDHNGAYAPYSLALYWTGTAKITFAYCA